LNDENTVPTQEEKEEFMRIVQRIDAICQHAAKNKVPIFIDAEESWIQDTLDRIVESMMAKYNQEHCIVFNTFQLYRHDRYDYIVKAIDRAKKGGYLFGAKIVRGAYMEKERE